MVTIHSPGRLSARQLGDAVLDVADRPYAPERGEDVAQRLAIHMGVAVGEAGNDGLALQVDHPRRRTDMRGHCGIRPDRHDTVAGDDNRLCDRERRVDGDDLAVLENEIGGPASRARRHHK